MIDWTRPYSCTWKVFRVNDATWADGAQVGGIDSVSVTRSCSGGAPLMESGSMTVTGNDFARGYYRVAMYARQNRAGQRVDVATLLCEGGKSTGDYGTRQHDVSCSSVLYPAYTQRMLDGSYIPAGADVAQHVADLLGSCIKAPIEVEGGFALSAFHWFEFGVRILDAAWEALKLGGYVMQIDGRGIVHIRPKPDKAAFSFDGADIALLAPSVSSEFDTSEVPNRYIAKDEEKVAIAVNDDPESDVSTVSRGYILDEVDDSPATLETETLAGYARRRLSEMSTGVADIRSYTREYVPDVYPFDLVEGTPSSIGLVGNARITNQNISCADGILVSEQAAREVALWQAT